MKKMLFAAFLPAAVILFALSAEALPVTYNFSGTYGLSTGFNSPSIDFTGATITGYYTIDDSTYYTGPLDLSGVVKYGSGNSLSFNFSSSYGQTFNSDSITGINTHYTLGLTDTLDGYVISQFLLTKVDIQMPFHTATDSYADFLYFNPISVTAASPVPIPGALVLFGSGLVGLIGYGRRRMRSSNLTYSVTRGRGKSPFTYQKWQGEVVHASSCLPSVRRHFPVANRPMGERVSQEGGVG